MMGRQQQMNADQIAKCKARGIAEVLRNTLVSSLVPGDEFVKPEYLSVYGTDANGYANLRADAGTRFRVTANTGSELTAVRVDGKSLSNTYPSTATVLKVIAVGTT
jgi:hypothetical protein